MLRCLRSLSFSFSINTFFFFSLFFSFFLSFFSHKTHNSQSHKRLKTKTHLWGVLKCGGRMGDCEKDLALDYYRPPSPSPPPPPRAKEEKEEKKEEEIQSSPSSSSPSHATHIETLVGDLQNLCLNNNNKKLDASDQDPVISTNETLAEGLELQKNHPISIIISSEEEEEEEEEEGSGETLKEGEGGGGGGELLQNLVSTSEEEEEGVETGGMISQLSTNLVRFFKKEKNDNPPLASEEDHATTTTTIETTTTTLDDGELQILGSEEGKDNQRDHNKQPDDDVDVDIKALTLVDGEELQHNLSSSPQKDNDHPTTTTTTTMEETLVDDVELHNPEVEIINPSCYSEWDKLHNPEQQQMEETNLISYSEWDDHGWEKDNSNHPDTNLISYSEWGDGTTREKDNNPQVEVETIIFKEEEEEEEVEEEKTRVFQYPLRPEEPDCVFYLRTGSCRYGFHCKFNHPPRKKHQLKAASSHLSDSTVQRVEPIPAIELVVKEKEREREDYTEWKGKIECKYYRTPGGCKFGKACRYYHPQHKNFVGPPTEFNFLGLPIRPGEKKCPFFMRTGSCKYATSCRFHHPDPTDAVEESDPLSGYHDAEYVELHSEGSPQPHATSWSLPGTYNEASPYMDTSSSYPTGIVSPSQTHHNREWNGGYQVPVSYSPERNRNPQSASLMNHSTRKANNSMHQQQQMVVDEFPERPGQHECQYYLKHGDCKYRSACRFHHPKNYSTNSPALSSIGLPLRPDQIICSNYSRFGICKYGPSCKYDHPA